MPLTGIGLRTTRDAGTKLDATAPLTHTVAATVVAPLGKALLGRQPLGAKASLGMAMLGGAPLGADQTPLATALLGGKAPLGEGKTPIGGIALLGRPP